MFIRVCGGRKKSEKFVSTKGTVTVTIGETAVEVAVKDNESASDIAKAIADAIKGNKDLNETYTASADGDKVVISATNNITAPTVSADFAQPTE